MAAESVETSAPGSITSRRIYGAAMPRLLLFRNHAPVPPAKHREAPAETK